MAKKHCSLVWDTHASYLTSGLTRLQQNEEFVDMTLGVEGHFVKVHKSVIALASPYLKEVIKSLNCPHPVIFLHNVSKDILGYLLDYIYLGEVVVPNEDLGIFIRNAKELHIAGIEAKFFSMVNQKTNDGTNYDTSQSVSSCPSNRKLDPQKPVEEYNAEHSYSPISNDVHTLPIILSNNLLKPADHPELHDLVSKDNEINCGVVDVPLHITAPNEYESNVTNTRNNQPNYDIDMEQIIPDNIIYNLYPSKDNYNIDVENVKVIAGTSSEEPRNIVIPLEDDGESGARSIVISTDVPLSEHAPSPLSTGQQYTVSNQGSMQMILNRYIYCVHFKSGKKGVKRRWRCLDYRRKGCKAYLDTIGENISNRVNEHTHPFHDKAVLMKVRKGLVFASVERAEESCSRRHSMNQPSSYKNDVNCASKNKSSRKRKINK